MIELHAVARDQPLAPLEHQGVDRGLPEPRRQALTVDGLQHRAAVGDVHAGDQAGGTFGHGRREDAVFADEIGPVERGLGHAVDHRPAHGGHVLALPFEGGDDLGKPAGGRNAVVLGHGDDWGAAGLKGQGAHQRQGRAVGAVDHADLGIAAADLGADLVLAAVGEDHLAGGLALRLVKEGQGLQDPIPVHGRDQADHHGHRRNGAAALRHDH